MVSDCPMVRISKQQTKTALSTMEAENISLAHCCRKFFPVFDIVNKMSDAIGLSTKDLATMRAEWRQWWCLDLGWNRSPRVHFNEQVVGYSDSLVLWRDPETRNQFAQNLHSWAIGWHFYKRFGSCNFGVSSIKDDRMVVISDHICLQEEVLILVHVDVCMFLCLHMQWAYLFFICVRVVSINSSYPWGTFWPIKIGKDTFHWDEWALEPLHWLLCS